MFEQCLAARCAVAGDAHVDAILGQARDFTADLQKLVTEAAWSLVSTRTRASRCSSVRSSPCPF